MLASSLMPSHTNSIFFANIQLLAALNLRLLGYYCSCTIVDLFFIHCLAAIDVLNSGGIEGTEVIQEHLKCAIELHYGKCKT